nr:multidrug resistance regulator 1 [Quercus suber]
MSDFAYLKRCLDLPKCSSCVLCRRRKLKCDRNVPCSNCIKSRTGRCTYDNGHSRSDIHQPPTPSSSSEEWRIGRVSTSPIQSVGLTPSSRDHATEPVKRQGARNVDTVRLRCRHEVPVPGSKHDQIQVHDPTSDPDAHMATTAVSGTFHFQYASNLPGGSRSVATIHKNRYFGQSHWVNSTPLVRSITTFQPGASD